MLKRFDDIFFGSSCNLRDYGEETICYPRRKNVRHAIAKTHTGRIYNKLLDYDTIQKRFNPDRCSKDGRRLGPSQKWLLATYPKSCRFIQIDIDNHIVPKYAVEQPLLTHCFTDETGVEKQFQYETDGWWESQARLESARLALQEDLEIVQGLCSAMGWTPIWTTSPGNLVNGKIEHGLYCWVFFATPIPVKTLESTIQAIKRQHGKYELGNLEFRFGGGCNLIRLPGQRGVQIVDPSTMAVADGDPLITFCQSLNEITLNTLRPVATAITKTQPGPEKQYRYRAPTYCPATYESARRERDTFKRSVDRRIGSRLAWSIHRGQLTVEDALDAFRNEMIACAPRNDDESIKSYTCSHPRELNRFCRDKLNWYLRTFNPKLGRSHRDEADARRFHHSAQIDVQEVVRHSRLSYDDKQTLASFLSLCLKYNGRVSCKKTYDSPEALCSKSEWKAFWGQVAAKRIVQVLDAHSVAERKCTQYAVSKEFITQMRVTQELYEQIVERISSDQALPVKEVFGDTPADTADGRLGMALAEGLDFRINPEAVEFSGAPPEMRG